MLFFSRRRFYTAFIFFCFSNDWNHHYTRQRW
jgi:hypothetical protein